MSVGPRAKKFNVVSNDHGPEILFFQFQTGNTLFRQNGSKKPKIGKLNGAVHFFCFRPQIASLGKLGPKNQSSQFELKVGT